MKRTQAVFVLAMAVVIAAVAPVAVAKPKPPAKLKVYGTIPRANAAAATEVYQTFVHFDPTIAQPNETPPTFAAGCRRLTARGFRCDWSGDAPDYYGAVGIVRVTFNPYGVDAVLSPGWTCNPEGNLYALTGVDLCP